MVERQVIEQQTYDEARDQLVSVLVNVMPFVGRLE